MMKSLTRRSLAGGVFVSVFMLACTLVFFIPATGPDVRTAHAEPGYERSETRVNNKYTGLTKCAACHFREYRDWQSTPHGNAFKILPKKYKNSAECLDCHVTKISETAISDIAMSSHVLGVSCESCHGPGGDHANYALSFVGQDRLFTEDELKLLRSKIQRLALDQCIKCHTSKSHKPHPKFDREKAPANKQSGSSALRSGSFFDVHGGQSK